MHDWSDNDLDGMSREAADNYGPGRGMPDWDSLQKKLDKELPERKEDNRRRFLFLIFLCLVLTGVTSYLLISRNSGIANQNISITSKDALNPGPERNDAGSLARGSRKNNDSDKKGNDKNTREQSLNTSDQSIASSRQQSPATTSVSAAPGDGSSYPSTGSRKNLASRKTKTTGKNGGEVLAVTIETNDVNKIKSPENKAGTQKNSESDIAAVVATTEAGNEVAANTVDAEKAETDKAVADQTALTKDTLSTNAEQKKAPLVKATPKGSAIEISVLAGIDASSVKFKYGDNAGINTGILLGYRFNKKWSVGTGLIYTKKNYTAAGSDFNPPKSYWTNGIKLDKVDGSCYMWEVPVYATYRFNSKRKSGWFVNMGLSSYFMTKENYTYHYKYNNGNPATRHWENGDPSNYWFSILGISGGWEKNISRGLSLSVAPYAKIPLQGVGFGDMRLSSYGLNLLLTYRKATGRK